MKSIINKNKHLFDIGAISLSVACLLHCTVLPLLIAVLPMWGVQLVNDEGMHAILIAIALPISLFGLWLGSQCHGHHRYMLIGIGGLALMMLGIMVPIEVLELSFTVTGIILVAVAHLLNLRSPKKLTVCAESECACIPSLKTKTQYEFE